MLRNATLSSQVTAADARAANAANAAQAAAQKDYAARNAALNREAATLNQKSQVIAAEIGELKANTIRADGMYVVGHDIKSGTWHTAGNGHLSGGLCRYTVLRNASMANNPPGPTYFDGLRRLRSLHLRPLHVGTRTLMTRPGVALERARGMPGYRQGCLPVSELAVARTRGGCEDKGRWFALWVKPVIAETGGQGAGQRRRRDLA